jgi:hypothetical protein
MARKEAFVLAEDYAEVPSMLECTLETIKEDTLMLREKGR